jgi:hypothetical protein
MVGFKKRIQKINE